MKKIYTKPICETVELKNNIVILAGSNVWNDVGNFGPGDKEDDDREDDDNWDKDWSWSN